MFETQKVRRHDKFRKEWSQHWNNCKSQMGQDQVSGGVSVLCWLAAPVAMFYGNLQNSVIRSISVLKSSSVISKIEKVPRGIRGEKSGKDMASSRNLVSTIGALASPKMGDGTR